MANQKKVLILQIEMKCDFANGAYDVKKMMLREGRAMVYNPKT